MEKILIGGEMVKDWRDQARKCLEILQKIDKLVDQLNKYDPYGDLAENFEDIYRERETKRLIKMIKDDLRKPPTYM